MYHYEIRPDLTYLVLVLYNVATYTEGLPLNMVWITMKCENYQKKQYCIVSDGLVMYFGWIVELIHYSYV